MSSQSSMPARTTRTRAPQQGGPDCRGPGGGISFQSAAAVSRSALHTAESAKRALDAAAMPPPRPVVPEINFPAASDGGLAAGLDEVRRGRNKVSLAPGHSPLDWAALRGSGKNLRGVDAAGPLRVTAEELARHKTREDAWTAIEGKVYNITAYLPFHPGGVKILMAVAGRDGTKMFQQIHRWVNYEYMLQPCFVGFLVH